MRLDEIQGSIRRAVLGESAAARAAAVKDVPRWAPLPGQARGDAKDELTRIIESGFSPERFRDDPEYAGRPEIRKLAEKYVPLALDREKAARTEEMIATSRHVAERAPAMRARLRRDEIDRAIAKLTAERETLRADDDEEETPGDAALSIEDTEAATPPETEE